MKSKYTTLALLLVVSMSVYAIIGKQKIEAKDLLEKESEPVTNYTDFRSELITKDTFKTTKIEEVLIIPKASDVSWHIRSF